MLRERFQEENNHLESPPLSATVVRQLMHKSVAAVTAFYGYEQVGYHQSILWKYIVY